MLDTLYTNLGETLRSAAGDSTALWFSGGKDSLLLLEALRALKLPFSVLRFDDGWSRRQKDNIYRTVARYSLPLYSYAPSSAMLIAQGTEVSLVAAYPVARSVVLPIVRDLIDNPKRCAIDIRMRIDDRSVPPVSFDAHILGQKRSDSHWSIEGSSVEAPEAEIDGVKFCYPLYEWTDAQVVEALALYHGIRYQAPGPEMDTGNIAACSRCLGAEKGTRVRCPKTGGEIDAFDWDPAANLAVWNAARNFAHNRQMEARSCSA